VVTASQGLGIPEYWKDIPGGNATRFATRLDGAHLRDGTAQTYRFYGALQHKSITKLEGLCCLALPKLSSTTLRARAAGPSRGVTGGTV